MMNVKNLLQVDGKTNPKIQSIFLEDFPIYCAHFSAGGEEVVLGSRHKTFQYYDMIAGKVVRVPQLKGQFQVFQMIIGSSNNLVHLCVGAVISKTRPCNIQRVFKL